MAGSDARALIARLKRLRHPGERRRTETYLAEGVGCLVAEVESSARVREIVHAPVLLRSIVGQVLSRKLRRSGVPYTKVSPETYRGFSMTPRASGIALVIHQHWKQLDHLRPGPTPVHVALGGVRSPGNLGTLLRTLEAVGGGGLIMLDPDLDPFAPDVLRASMGTVIRRQLTRTNRATLRSWATTHRVRIIGASPGAGQPYDSGDLYGCVVILLGEERRGLVAADKAICDAFVHIPILGRVDSLNLGVAGSMLLYETLRRRNAQSPWG